MAPRMRLSTLVKALGVFVILVQLLIIPGLLPSSLDDWSFGDLFDFSTHGSFNNIKVRLTDESFQSHVHCVGETHDPRTAWMHRSCRFSYMCLNTNTSEFFVVQDENSTEYKELYNLPHMYSSTSLQSDKSLAIGGINPRWEGTDFNQGIEKVKWFPKIVDKAPEQYYLLPTHVIMVPFHSMAGHNVGHLLWDDFLPIFNLMHIFGLMGIDGLQHMFLRWKPPAGTFLYGGCEMRKNKSQKCASNFRKFLPLMGVDPDTFSTTEDTKLINTEGGRLRTPIVCAKHAVAGIGKLTDHGNKDHGWDRTSELQEAVHNVGRGSLLYDFRTYIMYNMGLPIDPPDLTERPVRIVFSIHSSSEKERNLDFQSQYQQVSAALPGAIVDKVELANQTLQDQLTLASNTTIFVSTAGGGSMTATFLPRGATVILYYASNGGFDFGNFNLTGTEALLDWDLFNNLGYLRVHWMPIESMNTPEGLNALVHLIKHEWEVMKALPN